MGFILKYVQKTKSGYRYRRRWPQAVRETLNCGEYFFEILGKTEDDVVRSYAKAERSFKTKLAHAVSNGGKQVDINESKLTPLQIHNDVLERIRQMGFDPNRVYDLENPDDKNELDAKGYEADFILEKYIPQHEQDELDKESYQRLKEIPVNELALMEALNGTLPDKPCPTIEDARREYIEYKNYGHPSQKKNFDRINDVVSTAKEALGRDFRLDDFSTKDARRVLDYFIEKRGIKKSTLQRYRNDLRAMINFTIREFDCDGVVNRFEGIIIPKESNAKQEREPLTENEIATISENINKRAQNNSLYLIWALLNGTGCRLDEIASIRTADVILDGDIPYLRIEEFDGRRLKTASSVRSVPLVSKALEAAKNAVREANGSDKLFPRYFGKSDNASSALMTYVKGVRTNENKTVHSLRHTMKDRLKLVGATKQVQDEILGHSSGDIGERYGGEEVRLKLSYACLVKVFQD